jgi:hypothetical protein
VVRRKLDGAGVPEVESLESGAVVRSLEAIELAGGGLLLALASRNGVTAVRRGEDGTFGRMEPYPLGTLLRMAVVADIDGDSLPDCAAVDFSSQAVFLLRGSPGAVEPRLRRGDADLDGTVGLTDAVAVLESLFRGGGALRCPDAADADDDGSLNVTDAVRTLAYLFQGGPAPAAPGPDACGPDSTHDDLEGCLDACR